MHIKVLGSSGSEVAGHRSPAFLVDGESLLDAGTIGLSMNIRRRPERGSVWRIAPPLTVSYEEMDEAIGILDQALTESVNELAAETS